MTSTNGLAKLYDRLTPRERLPLILAASARGDEAELDRLVNSAPSKVFRVPDYFGQAEGLELAALLQQIELLDVAAAYWWVGGMLAEHEAWTDGEEDEPSKRLRAVVRMFAYIFTTKLDGWRQFCAESKIDAEQLMNGLPGYDTVVRTEEAARMMAFTVEEAIIWMKERDNEAVEVLTVDSVVASLWSFISSRANLWE
jgi:hypothetical protein